jgi:hypothetical protein
VMATADDDFQSTLGRLCDGTQNFEAPSATDHPEPAYTLRSVPLTGGCVRVFEAQHLVFDELDWGHKTGPF